METVTDGVTGGGTKSTGGSDCKDRRWMKQCNRGGGWRDGGNGDRRICCLSGRLSGSCGGKRGGGRR